MLKTEIEKILNIQIEKEAYSSNLYLAMAIWAETSGLESISKWIYAQAEEERMHMLKFISYVNERGGKAVIPALKKLMYNTPGKVFLTKFDDNVALAG